MFFMQHGIQTLSNSKNRRGGSKNDTGLKGSSQSVLICKKLASMYESKRLHQKIPRSDEQCQQNGWTQGKINSLQYTNNKHTEKEPIAVFHSL